MDLIEKSALVAEIEKLEIEYMKLRTHNSYERGLKDGRLIGYKDALHKIYTLEVKKVYLNEELVAEIEKYKKLVEKRLFKNNSYSHSGEINWERDKALYDCYNKLLSFINSLKVKEVDLDNHTIMEEIRKCGCNPSEFDVAKHFFELGLKAKDK